MRGREGREFLEDEVLRRRGRNHIEPALEKVCGKNEVKISPVRLQISF